MIKIAQAIKGMFAPAKPPPPVKYYDQEPMRIMHSSLEADRAQQADGWLSANGRYNFRSWINR